VIRQSFAGSWGARGSLGLDVLPNGALQWANTVQACADGLCSSEEILVLLVPAGPGRWTPADPAEAGFDGELWVMWMDFADRTAAIGTPDGQFGFIMDKSSTGGGDRIIAARDIMAWFGYDISQLKETSP